MRRPTDRSGLEVALAIWGYTKEKIEDGTIAWNLDRSNSYESSLHI